MSLVKCSVLLVAFAFLMGQAMSQYSAVQQAKDLANRYKGQGGSGKASGIANGGSGQTPALCGTVLALMWTVLTTNFFL
ncbi:hypothetical protein PoB_006508500 [Plakobranchus ocellatus]|uniref:Uncharacterized protein n=1 Tax=Plakobranchus ocellatus TaxID=259542 RepID=A0AAV4D3M6_9GAST|nr:hypothetical protein PoB_006508500 [Plakobranchus ocellatus]